MIKTTIGGIDVQSWITAYKVDNPPVYGNNSFIDVSGAEVTDKLGDKVILTITMADIPTATAQSIASALMADSIAVTYTTPAPASNNFKKTAYTATCSNADPDESDYTTTTNITWDIDVTLESIDFNSAASGNSL